MATKDSFLSKVTLTVCNFSVIFVDFTNIIKLASTIEISANLVSSFITGNFISLQNLADKELSTGKVCLFQSK